MSSRAQQSKRVANLLVDECHVALHAGPGAGKTWLADEVVSQFADPVHRWRADLSAFKSGRDFFIGLTNEVARSSDDENLDIHAAWRALHAHLNSRSDRLVVIIDEFDAVLRFGDGQDFLRLLRELFHRPAVTKCVALILSRRPLANIEAEMRGISTLATLCFPEYLGALSVEDLSTFSSPREPELAEAEVERCLAWSAGYPPLVKYWMSVRPEDYSDAQSEYQQAVMFERLIAHLELVDLHVAAAQLVLGPVVDDWLRESRELEVLGVLSSSGGPAYSGHEVFRDYLRSRSLNLNPWGVLGEAEVALRSLVSSVYSSRFGTSWLDEVGASNRVVRRLRASATSMQEADRRRFGRSGDWLAYTYPKDLADIILSDWSVFVDVFSKGDRRYWSDRFSRLAEYRTPMAHNRVEVLSAAQRTQCRLIAEEVVMEVGEFHARSVDDS